MFKYANFLMANILKKWSVWILLTLALVATYFVVWVQIGEFNKYGVRFTQSINTYTKMIPFIFGISFITLIIVYVFKDGEDDGSDLLILSKPISRGKILLGKFWIVFLFIIGFNVLYFFTSYISVQTDTFSSQSQMAKFALSISLGSIIVTSIVTMIIIFVSSFSSKIGTLAIGIVTAAVVPIVSQVVVAASHAIPTGKNQFNKNAYIINASDVESVLEDTFGDFVRDGDADVNINKVISVRKRRKHTFYDNAYQKALQYEASNWYDKASFVDPWYQLSGFYDMFLEDSLIDIKPENWTARRAEVHISDEEAIEQTVDGRNIAVPVDIFTHQFFHKEVLVKDLLEILTGQKKETIVSSGLPDINGSTDYLYSKDSNGNVTTKKAAVTWEDVETDGNALMSGKLDPTKYEAIPVIDYFTNSAWSFEDRLRAVIYAMKGVAKDGKLKNLSVQLFDIDTYIAYLLIVDALEDKDAFAKRLSSITGVTPEVKQLIDLVNTSFHATANYKHPQNAFGFYRKKEYIAKKQAELKAGTITTGQFNASLKNFQAYQPEGIMVDGDVILQSFVEPYVEKHTTLMIWGILGAFMILITGIRYWRRDFK